MWFLLSEDGYHGCLRRRSLRTESLMQDDEVSLVVPAWFRAWFPHGAVHAGEVVGFFSFILGLVFLASLRFLVGVVGRPKPRDSTIISFWNVG